MDKSDHKLSLTRELKDIALLALLGGLVTTVPFCLACGIRRFLLHYLISAFYWVFLAKGNAYLTAYLDRRISWLKTPVKRLVWGMVCMLVYTLAIAAALHIAFNWILSDKSLAEVISWLTFESLSLAILITLIISMFLHGRSFYINWKATLLREEKLKNAHLRSQYESLKNQVNPHFLFNSLNVLSGLVYEDQKRAVEFIRKMAEVYRYVLENKDHELIPLEDELIFLNNYVYLQKIRFGDNFTLEIEQAGRGYVPPLALQLLVENAIKHNIVSEARPLHVKVAIQSDHIFVTNNIQEKLTKDSTGIGLSNLKARYSYFSDRPVLVGKSGSEFQVTLPLLQVETE